MLKTQILPQVVAQEGERVSQRFIKLAGLAGSALRAAILTRADVPAVRRAHSWERKTLGSVAERKPNGLLLHPPPPVTSFNSNAPCMDYSVTVSF